MQPGATLMSVTAALEECCSTSHGAGTNRMQLQQRVAQLECELDSAVERADAAEARQATCAHKLAEQTQRTQEAEKNLHMEQQLRQIALQGLLNMQQ